MPVAAVISMVVVVHLYLHRRRRGVIVAAERHAGRGKSLEREPQQQKAENEFVQQLLHFFLL